MLIVIFMPEFFTIYFLYKFKAECILMKKKICFFLLVLIPFYFEGFSQEHTGLKEAFLQAKSLNRPVFLVFSGSDWCVPCIRFEKEVLSDSLFIRYAEDNLVILKAEFPQKKKLEPEMVARNEALADRYNPRGLFPHLLLLQPDGEIIAELDYDHQTPVAFVSQIETVLAGTASLNEFDTITTLMGCTFEFTVVDSEGTGKGWELIQESISEVKRIENLISEWSDTTQVGRLNTHAGISPVKVSPEVYGLITRSMAVSELTQGAFDITFSGAGKLWKFDPEDPVIPDSARIREALKTVGYKKIRLMDSSLVYLEEPGMRIGFGAIGKGYSAERVKQMMLENGITGGVINASGDLTAWGKRGDGTAWKVGIADPDDPSRVLLWLPVENSAVATSGNYEKYVMIDGRRYGHIIDPRTGYPVSGVKSVTVISPNAELSDAIATAVFVMGVETGLDFIEQLPDVHCIIIDNENKIHYSEGIDLHN